MIGPELQYEAPEVVVNHAKLVILWGGSLVNGNIYRILPQNR